MIWRMGLMMGLCVEEDDGHGRLRARTELRDKLAAPLERRNAAAHGGVPAVPA